MDKKRIKKQTEKIWEKLSKNSKKNYRKGNKNKVINKVIKARKEKMVKKIKEFVGAIDKILGQESREDMIEKDILLHQLLLDLSKEKFFQTFLFKGGTCLIKYYFGYYRFSEDIDFTWKKQEIFRKRSQKKIRKYISKIMDKFGLIFKKIAKTRGFDFKYEKNNRKYVEFGGGNKLLTFKIWYLSHVLKKESFVKVQINFVEKICFQTKKIILKNLISEKLNKKESKELEFLFPKLFKEYSAKIILDAYNLQEILCEKIRAVLTRRGIKTRDFFDIYLICKELKIDLKNLKSKKLQKLKKAVIEKTIFVLNQYNKYQDNFIKNKKLLENIEIRELFKFEEERLLLVKINKEEFYYFLNYFTKFLLWLSEDLNIKFFKKSK